MQNSLFFYIVLVVVKLKIAIKIQMKCESDKKVCQHQKQKPLSTIQFTLNTSPVFDL